ncbi:MAG: peptidoglycan-binding domain-containing protein [Rhodomicrobium sp.]
MHRTLIALLASAALTLPAMAQQQDTNPGNAPDQNQNATQNAPNQNAVQNEPNPGGGAGPQVGGPGGGRHMRGAARNTGRGRHVRLSRSQVMTLQRDLDRSGDNAGRAHGIMGPRTRAALRRFQQQKGLNATGQPTPRTLAALGINERGMRRNRRTASNRGMTSRRQRQAYTSTARNKRSASARNRRGGTQGQPGQGGTQNQSAPSTR